MPQLVDDTIPAWRRKLLERHISRCEECTDELERQRTVAVGLREFGETASQTEPDPPEDLLDEILERVNEPHIRERVAGPARGAVSGARPELSIAALLVAAAVLYLTWRAARRLIRLRRD